MATVATWLSQELQHKEALMTIDNSYIEALREEGVLEMYMPKKPYDSFEFIDYIVEKIIPTASIIAYDSELPTEDFGKIQKITGEVFKIGLQYQFDEKTQKKLAQAMKMAQKLNVGVQNIYPSYGDPIKGSDNAIARYIFGAVADVTTGLVRRLKAVSWQAVQMGVVDYQDPLTKATLQFDYRDPNAKYGYAPQGKLAHFPAGLSGANRWDQYATANGLRDIRNWCRQFQDDTGRKPDGIGLSEDAWEHLKLQESTRNQYGSIQNVTAGVTVSSVSVMTDSMLGMLVRNLRLPTIHLIEEEYFERDLTTKNRKRVRYLAENRIVFFCKGMGEMAIGPTIENDLIPGPYVLARELQKFPPRDAIQGVMTGLPVIPNPKLLFSTELY